MIVTRNWLNEYIEIKDISSDEICKALNAIGLEVDSLKKCRIPSGIVVGKVLSCQKHPDADKLNVTTVDVGSETLQIVCGAKNVAKGQFVCVAKIGAVLGKDFKIKEAKLRGVDSNGMICSSSEIGLVETNDGIIELDDSIGELVLGRELSQYPLLNDDIIEIELTANRGDCLSIHGVARDLSAALNVELIQKETTYVEDQRAIGRVVELDTSGKIDCSLKYMFFEKNGLKTNFLTTLRLCMVDIKISNEIVNHLSYATHESGVILRSYDFSKLKQDENEKAVLSLVQDDDNIDRVYSGCDVVSSVGLEQNSKFDIDFECSKVLVEASYIKPDVIASKKYENKLSSDELYYKSSRGSETDLSLGLRVLSELMSDGSKIYSGYEETIDSDEELMIQVQESFIHEFIGDEISDTKIIQILQSLGFDVEFRGEYFIVKVPRFRSDIKNPQDVIEEIVRIYGIDNIVSKALVFSERRVVNSTYEKIKKRRFYRNRCVGAGFYESVHYFFENRDDLDKYGFITVKSEMDLKNPISSELNSFRTTLSLHLLRSASKNSKVGRKSIKIFELGRVVDESLNESEKLSFILSGDSEDESLKNSAKVDEFSFVDAVLNLSKIVGEFSLVKGSTNSKLFNPYEYARVIVKGDDIGFISRVHLEVEKEFSLKRSYICELDFESLKYEIIKVNSYSKFQSSQKDLSFLIDGDMSFEKIKSALDGKIDKAIVSFYPIDLYEGDELEGGQSLTMRFILQLQEKTLQESDIVKAMESVKSILKDKLALDIR